jgi:hypothetical protein
MCFESCHVSRFEIALGTLELTIGHCQTMLLELMLVQDGRLGKVFFAV